VSGPVISDADGEVLAALTTLGYSAAEAQAALRALPADMGESPLEEKIRVALISLSRL
jgi:Holliday junction DNA helicase RuvA